ncbi:TetR/AcrR family transcriptional regulator [Alkaliphilus peptidifermentans]|uniref:Transcriptional regulator, TetR family n=1 Tax=Alkaliphilus peptidifermentans DSM 18978 TaxID=1120976 RepID=A0A1G5HB40_9FIRM|nr:TetR/AcrR family transcriptional regulator [Alkaliphilus peptidifermentans]SCY60937.1 transcriptional regulator, TetR family [Alkaliphilus peptidifermentans DSM 18978]
MNNIKECIYNVAKDLFSQQGFKDTNISAITKKVGIGVGTFYNYYTSKEELFMKIFIDENMEMKRRILDLVDLNGDPAPIIKEVVLRIFEEMKSNPILVEWYNRETYHKIIEKLYKEVITNEEEDIFYQFFFDLIENWQKEGKIRRDIASEEILALFDSLSFVDLHKEEIGSKYFPQTMNYLVEFITKGLKG